MKTKDTIEKLHDWLNDVKTANNYSYGYLGDIVNISDVAIGKAMRNKKLSIDRIKLIARRLNLENEFNEIVSNKSNKPNLPKQIYVEKTSEEKPKQVKDNLEARLELLETTVNFLKEQLKMQQDNILFLQNIVVVNNKEAKKKSS